MKKPILTPGENYYIEDSNAEQAYTTVLLSKRVHFYNFVCALILTSNITEIVILVAVVVYRAPKEDRSVTEGMTCHDVDVISRAQYITM